MKASLTRRYLITISEPCVLRRSAFFNASRLLTGSLLLLGVGFFAWSEGRLHLRKTPEELRAIKADQRWFETYCTRDYIAAHPWTPEELSAMQMDFRRRRIEWEAERSAARMGKELTK